MTQEEFVISMVNRWGLSNEEKDIEIKKARIRDLLFSVDFPPMLIQFFDLNSSKLLDEKIEVLIALKNGKEINEIPNFYKVLELYPKNTDEKIILWD